VIAWDGRAVSAFNNLTLGVLPLFTPAATIESIRIVTDPTQNTWMVLCD